MDKVIHFEIPADDVDRAQRFYHDVFGWQINPVPQLSYTTVFTGPTDAQNMLQEKGFINGGMMQRSDDIKNPVIIINVADIDKAAAIIIEHGGRVIRPKMAVGDMGFAAYFTDSEGNVMGLWQNPPGR